MEIAVFLLTLAGLFLLLGISLPSGVRIRARIADAARQLRRLKLKKPESAREYVAKINGTAKADLFTRSRREAQSVYQKTGQDERYQKTLHLAMITAATGVMIGLTARNIPLAVVLGIGLYFIPLWVSRFSLYRYNRFLNEELEVALSLITTSYTRSGDILGAVTENINHINSPVKEVFISFVNNLKYVDANAPAQIERMKRTLDNKLFWKWCDSLILCQSDHTLRATLLPIVASFSALKAQQMENETNMMRPIKQAVLMTLLTVGIVPLLRMLNTDWYMNLMNTAAGQIALSVTAVAVLFTINKAIRLSQPVEYDI